ncbi:MAG: hypothetical protein EZS28_035322, partial [Streblomastix strix]
MATQTDQDTILASQSTSTQELDKELQTPHTFGKGPITKLDIFERLSGISDDDNALEHEMVDIEDDFMNSIELRVLFDLVSGRIFIFEQNKPVAKVKAQGFHSKSGRRSLGTQFQQTTLDEERAWLASNKTRSSMEFMKSSSMSTISCSNALSSSDMPLKRS